MLRLYLKYRRNLSEMSNQVQYIFLPLKRRRWNSWRTLPKADTFFHLHVRFVPMDFTDDFPHLYVTNVTNGAMKLSDLWQASCDSFSLVALSPELPQAGQAKEMREVVEASGLLDAFPSSRKESFADHFHFHAPDKSTKGLALLATSGASSTQSRRYLAFFSWNKK